MCGGRCAYEEASRDLTSARSSLAETEALVLALKEEKNDSKELSMQLEVLKQSHAELQKAKAEAEEHALEAHLRLDEAEAKADARIQLFSYCGKSMFGIALNSFWCVRSEKESVCGELREARILLSNQEQAFKAYQQQQQQMVKEEGLQREKLQEKQQRIMEEQEQRLKRIGNKLDKVEQEKLGLQQRNVHLDVQLREVERV